VTLLDRARDTYARAQDLPTRFAAVSEAARWRDIEPRLGLWVRAGCPTLEPVAPTDVKADQSLLVAVDQHLEGDLTALERWETAKTDRQAEVAWELLERLATWPMWAGSTPDSRDIQNEIQEALASRPDRPPDSLARAILDGWAALRQEVDVEWCWLAIDSGKGKPWMWFAFNPHTGALDQWNADPLPDGEAPNPARIKDALAWPDLDAPHRQSLLAAWAPVARWHAAGRPEELAPWRTNSGPSTDYNDVQEVMG